jgi:hypothetical protein
MNNKDETTRWRWSGEAELMVVLVFVCVNSSLSRETERQPRQQLQCLQK